MTSAKLSLLLILLFSGAALAEAPKEGEYVSMFNGKDLTGWVNVNCHPDTFYVKDGMIITTGKPTGFMRTERQYENFVMEFEWMHIEKEKMANSGLFVWGDPIPATGSGYTRGIEVQVLINFEKDWATSHGDVFAIWGAICKPDRPHPKGAMRCLPSERLCKGAGEWNHYKVIANDGAIKLHVNGKEVSGVSACNPRKGYLALESEGAECRFRNLKIKELPSTMPKPDQIADEAKGFKNIYTGLDLDNFEKDPGHEGHWQPSDWKLHYDGMSETESRSLYVEKEQGDYEMVVDWMLPAKKGKETSVRQAAFILRERPDYMLTLTARADGRMILMENVEERAEFLADQVVSELKPPGQWNRAIISIRGGVLNVTLNGKAVIEKRAMPKMPKLGVIALMDSGTEMDFANLFLRPLK